MNTTIVTTVILLSGVCVLLTGCASSPPTHFYTLDPVHTSQEPPHSARKKMLVGIGPVELPKLLDRTQIVTKHEDNRVELAEFHQWGEPLKENVTRVLTRNMTSLRANDVIRSYPWGAFGTVDYRVVLNFLQFDPIPGKNVTLEVDWIIMNEKNHQVLKNGHSIIEQAIDNQSYQAIVEALSKTLGVLSQELSNSLDKVTNEI